MSTAQILEKLSSIDTRITAVEDRIKTAAAARNHGGVPGGAPFARTGENIMGSRGFSYAKAIAVTSGYLQPEHAKIETDFMGRFQAKMLACGWRPDRPTRSNLVPLEPAFFSADQIDENLYAEMKGLMYAGTAGADPDEVESIARKHFGAKVATSPAMSWIDQSQGGSLVGPATFGPPIELLRNKEALMAAGATVVPLGPTGRLQLPRLTAATQGGWAGENTSVNPNVAKTGSLILSAKKVIAVVIFPGELLRFASPAAEVVVRNDLFKTVALIADKGYLEGPGSDVQPLGLATMGAADAAATGTYGTNTIAPSSTNQLAPQDFYDFISAIEENNGDSTKLAWIMRPKMLRAAQKARWTPYSGGISQGGFTFDLTRTLAGSPGARELLGLPAVTTPQVSNTRGSGAQTYVLCLDPEDYYLGLFGALEVTQTDGGIQLLQSDQVAVRAILTTDGGMRHPGLVSFADNLNFVVAG